MPQDNQGTDAMREGEKEVSRFAKWRRAILGTLGAVGIWIAAIFSVQQPVVVPDMPIQQVAAQEWIFTNDWQITASNWTITVRAGFRLDLASIPPQARKPLGLWPDSPSIRRAAATHDALYASELLPRDTADALLYWQALRDGTDPAKARAVWEAVSLWGFLPWGTHTPESVEQARRLVTLAPRR